MDNLFQTPSIPVSSEVIETLLHSENVTIERIISHCASSPPDFWYDQPRDEWVVLLRGTATLSFENSPATHLQSGDHLLIPAHQKHRVEKTSADALWLAVHLGKTPSQPEA